MVRSEVGDVDMHRGGTDFIGVVSIGDHAGERSNTGRKKGLISLGTGVDGLGVITPFFPGRGG